MTTGGKARPVVAPPWVFYGAPYVAKGLWIRSDLCSAQVDCSYCGARKWEPCRSVRLSRQLLESGGPEYEKVIGAHISGSHVDRRKAAKKIPSSGLEITVRTGDAGPPCGGYRISLALPPTVES